MSVFFSLIEPKKNLKIICKRRKFESKGGLPNNFQRFLMKFISSSFNFVTFKRILTNSVYRGGWGMEFAVWKRLTLVLQSKSTHSSPPGRLRVILPTLTASPYFKYPKNPTPTYRHATVIMPVFNTPVRPPKSWGVCILFSRGRTWNWIEKILIRFDRITRNYGEFRIEDWSDKVPLALKTKLKQFESMIGLQ